jgi:peptide-methionine (S)-S-oxide reductase
MSSQFARNGIRLIAVAAVVTVLCSLSLFHSAHAQPLPDPAQDMSLSPQPGSESIVLAGGCFWGVQAVFQHTKGVKQAVSGYAGGEADTAHYEMVSTGSTGHAESVQVTYDPSEITLGKILKVYFAVAHDPTELDYQGPDHGTQYRSAIFYSTPQQKKLAEDYIAQLQREKVFSDPIVTTLEPLKAFYAAEDYHQNYARLHPDNTYIAMNDLPKVDHLEKELPDLYVK